MCYLINLNKCWNGEISWFGLLYLFRVDIFKWDDYVFILGKYIVL